jgi:hypothetical protein
MKTDNFPQNIFGCCSLIHIGETRRGVFFKEHNRLVEFQIIPCGKKSYYVIRRTCPKILIENQDVTYKVELSN